jgi:SAM-dependent methyltransferase
MDQYRDASNLNARIQLHERFSTNRYGWYNWVFDLLDLPADSCILELGCGKGGLWRSNDHRIPESWSITLSDLSPGMLQDAQRNIHPTGRRYNFIVADAQAIPCQSRSLSAVVANHMLYHVPDRSMALSEIHRVLKHSGRLYAATIGQAHMSELEELVKAFDPGITFRPREITEGFNLENGLSQLHRHFSQVSLHRYEDSLLVTEARPLIAYVLSSASNASSVLVDGRLAEFEAMVKRRLKEDGALRITKASGLFKALRGDGL